MGARGSGAHPPLATGGQTFLPAGSDFCSGCFADVAMTEDGAACAAPSHEPLLVRITWGCWPEPSELNWTVCEQPPLPELKEVTL